MRHACLTNDAPILCVIPYALPDATQAWELLNWIGELNGCKHNDCLLVASAKVDSDTNREMLSMAASVFRNAELITTPGNLPDERWPIGPNWMFQTAMNWVYQRAKVPWWWNEPDCIPLCEGWLELLEQEYYRAGKPFMGSIVKGVTIRHMTIPDSINGCAVYPADTAIRFGKIAFGSPEAWDILAGQITVPQAHHSKVYQYFWGEPGLAPTFREHHEKGEPKNVFTLEQIRKDAVVFHRNKDGTLIQRLRDKRNKTCRIIHVVECHDPMDERVRRAVASWVPLQSDAWETIHCWKYPRSSQEIGDDRTLPYLKDILKIGMDRARDNDIVCLTNGDNLLHRELGSLLEGHLEHVPAVCSFRLNITAPASLNCSPAALCKLGKPDFGRDLFAFKKWWLVQHWEDIPDMFLGEWEWDLIMALLIRRSNGVKVTEKQDLNFGDPRSELPLGFVFHEIHERKWMSKEALKMPAKWHNQRLAKQWYSEQGMEKFYTLI